MSKTILIVDDNANMSALLSEMLEVFEYESELAADGAEALEKLDAGPFSMVITDMRMPHMSGLQLLKQVRTRYPKMPVVLISGYSVSDVEGDSEGTKPDGFLAKPFMMSDIEELLNSLLS
jgi:DNA-binding NtrC family response regulator